ncbi:MAG: BtaA family protein, partial [Bacteroidota bacterium]
MPPMVNNPIIAISSPASALSSTSWKNWVFRRVHGQKIVYNCCWEDPRCDRELLNLDSDSNIVMITSAGCNALDYLLDDPSRVHCIDVNPRQNALLHLKQAAYRTLDHAAFFDIFGRGNHPEFQDIYHSLLREELPFESAFFWDRHLNYFKPQGRRNSFYYRGSSGALAWAAVSLLRQYRKLFKAIEDLWDSPTLDIQRERYLKIEPKLLKLGAGGPLRQHLWMSLAGVPQAQRQLIKRESGNLQNYLRQQVRHIFADLPLSDNYFYSVYLHGRYDLQCCPSYLSINHFDCLQKRENRLKTYTNTLATFLKENPKPYSHFVLLDHQDWLAAHDPKSLKEEWQLILKNSKPGTKILL